MFQTRSQKSVIVAGGLKSYVGLLLKVRATNGRVEKGEKRTSGKMKPNVLSIWTGGGGELAEDKQEKPPADTQ